MELNKPTRANSSTSCSSISCKLSHLSCLVQTLELRRVFTKYLDCDLQIKKCMIAFLLFLYK